MKRKLQIRCTPLITMVSARLERVSPTLRKALKIALNTAYGTNEMHMSRM